MSASAVPALDIAHELHRHALVLPVVVEVLECVGRAVDDACGGLELILQRLEERRGGYADVSALLIVVAEVEHDGVGMGCVFVDKQCAHVVFECHSYFCGRWCGEYGVLWHIHDFHRHRDVGLFLSLEREKHPEARRQGEKKDKSPEIPVDIALQEFLGFYIVFSERHRSSNRLYLPACASAAADGLA